MNKTRNPARKPLDLQRRTLRVLQPEQLGAIAAAAMNPTRKCEPDDPNL